jgi:flagellar biosynthesis protein FlhG
MGLANVDILLGLYPEYSLEDVILGGKRIGDIIIKDYMGIDIVPGSSGIQRLADPSPEEIEFLIKALSELEGYDFLIFDTSAGISKNVVSFCMASSEIILVVTPEPTSLTDAYALLKILSLNGFNDSVMVAVNQCKDIQVAGVIFTKFKAAVEKFLPLKILPVGTIIRDDHISEAVKMQKPFLSIFPRSDAAKGIKNIGRRLLNRDKAEFNEYGLKTFWSRCFRLFNGPLQLTASRVTKDAPVQGKVITEGPGLPRGKALNEKADPLMTPAEQPANPKATGEAPEGEEKGIAHQDLPIILDKLSQGISTISSELGAIRRIMERGYMNSGQGLKRD